MEQKRRQSSAFFCSFTLMKKLVVPLLFFAASAIGQTTADTIRTIEPNKIYRTAETDSKPEPVAGMYTLSMYISKNLKLPEVHNKKLMLFVGFVVETDSTLSDIKFIHLTVDDLYGTADENATDYSAFADSPLFDEIKAESVKVLSDFAGKWIPATKDNLPVRCQYNYPIIINIE